MAPLEFLKSLTRGIPLNPLPPYPDKTRNPNVPHAPKRNVPLNSQDKKLAVQNHLRYFPKEFHPILASEFEFELETYGHIYGYRFIPKFPIKAYSINEYPAKTQEARAIQLMIFNNLDPAVAQFPEELVTYGGNGQVLSNWIQFWVMMKYLSEMEDTQVLIMYSGHPLGLFPRGSSDGPRVIITNGMVIPNYSKPEDYDRLFSLGCSMYGQMTAGSYCYIGPQGIVHGTTITLINAGRKYLNTDSLAGKVFVSSGLGGMSGAQGKAGCVAGCISVIAEVNWEAIKKRFDQGWVKEIIEGDLNKVIKRIKEAKDGKEVTSIGFYGNVVDLWEKIADEHERNGELLVDLGSDQTSLHNPFNGGYYPASLSFVESQQMMKEEPEKFKEMVRKSLIRQVKAIQRLTNVGMRFWDYGNAFLLEAKRAGAPIVKKEDPSKFIYPSYVQDIMGDIFSLGFGPFRWVCTSGNPKDLVKTDQAAVEVFNELLRNKDLSPEVRYQYLGNLKWIEQAGENQMVVGSQARILYSDCKGRITLAKKFNELIKSGIVEGPIVLSRDHHDVSGTDSPYRETSNITDGSEICADMAVQNFIGGGIRGASWVALHNGGGVGWGEVINGGFGLLLNGTNSDVAENLLLWDVNNGIARRAWSGNTNALNAIQKAMESNPLIKVTLPNY